MTRPTSLHFTVDVTGTRLDETTTDYLRIALWDALEDARGRVGEVARD